MKTEDVFVSQLFRRECRIYLQINPLTIQVFDVLDYLYIVCVSDSHLLQSYNIVACMNRLQWKSTPIAQ